MLTTQDILISQLKKYQFKSGISVKDLDSEFKGSYSKWTAGKSIPGAEKVVRLAEIFGCTTDELLLGISQAPHTITGVDDVAFKLITEAYLRNIRTMESQLEFMQSQLDKYSDILAENFKQTG
jgi:transcriptional regulator with XRE-family HTH domain